MTQRDRIVISHYRPGSFIIPDSLIVILRQRQTETYADRRVKYYAYPSDRDIRRLTQCAERLTAGSGQVREYRYSTHYIINSQETTV